MRLAVEHRLTVRFPVARRVHLLRLTPASSHDQMVADWRIDVDCDARLRDGRDGFGNCVTMLYVDGGDGEVTITARGDVVLSHSDGVLHGVGETLPPALYRRASAVDPAIARFAAEAAGGREPLSTLHALNTALYERWPIDDDRAFERIAAPAEADGASAADALAAMFVAAARLLGAPARYVSGYRLSTGGTRTGRHGWAEAHVEGIGWIGFDPSTGLSPEDEYVRVAIGLDAAGAAPVAGWPSAGEVQVTRQD